MAQVLHNLGVERAMVVFGKDGLDEISLSSDTICVELKHGEFRRYEITPEQFGFKRCKKEELVGGNPTVNAEIAKKILKGEETGAKADAVLLNAGVGIYLMQEGITIAEGIQIAKNTIESGKAYAKLEEFIALTNEA